jgi:hypothetical protein
MPPTAGGLRADFVKGPQTPHSTFLLDVRYWNMDFATSLWTVKLGPQDCARGVRVRWSVVSGAYTGMGDWARQIGADKRQSVTDFRKFLRSQTGHIIAVYLCHA